MPVEISRLPARSTKVRSCGGMICGAIRSSVPETHANEPRTARPGSMTVAAWGRSSETSAMMPPNTKKPPCARVRTVSSDWRSIAASKKRPSAVPRMFGSGEGKGYLKPGIGSGSEEREARSPSGGPAGGPQVGLQAVDDAVEPEVERLLPGHRLGELLRGVAERGVLVRRQDGRGRQ